MPDNLPNQNLYVTVNGAAKLLGVSIDTVRRWDASGTIHSVRLDGKNRYFLKSELKVFAKNRPFSISEAAHQLSVSVSTLRRLEGKGVIVADRSANGERLYQRSRINEILASRKKGADKRVDLFAPIPTTLHQVNNSGQPLREYSGQAYAQPSNAGTQFNETTSNQNGSFVNDINSSNGHKKKNFWEKNYMLRHVGQFSALSTYVGGPKPGFKGMRFGNHAPEYKRGIAMLTFMLVLSSGIFVFTVLRDSQPPNEAMLSQAPASQRALAGLTPQQRAQVEKAQVLAAETTKGKFTVNIQSLFNEDVAVNNKNLTLGTGKLTASNVIYSITGGPGITVSPGQNPVASN